MNTTNINLHPEPEQRDKDTQQLAATREAAPTIQPKNYNAVLDDELYLSTTSFTQLVDFDEYLAFGGTYTEDYFEQYEQSEQCLYLPTEEEYSEYLESLENDQVRD